MGRAIKVTVICVVLAVCCWAANGRADENLIVNGDFSAVGDDGMPEGWMCDWAWTDNSHWQNCPKYIEIKEKDGVKRNVLALTTGVPPDESIIASSLFPYKRGDRFLMSLHGRRDGVPGPTRIYIRGYKWKPGVKPYPNPHVGDLRNVFRGRPFDPVGKSWKHYTRQFPYYSKGRSSEINLKHLKHVRFLQFYIVIPGAPGTTGTIFIDNVKIVKQ